MIKFSLSDTKEILIGSFIASLFFFALRFNEVIDINITAGIAITILVILLSNPRPRRKNLDIFAIEIVLVYITVAVMGIIFKLGTIEMVTFGLSNGTFPNLSVFGSGIIIAMWLALPVAIIYNNENLDNFLSRIFTRRR